MKIAICGSDDASRLNLIKSFMKQWPMYATPAATIFDSDINIDIPESLLKTKEECTPIEWNLFTKMLLLEKQYEMYKESGHIIYNGSPSDILINALILCEEGYVSEEFVEKIIYHHRRALKRIDVIYFLPDNNITEESPEDAKKLENVYWNFYENYQENFTSSPFFDQTDCPSFLLLESDNPIGEMMMLLDKYGNLESSEHGGTDGGILEIDRLKKVLRKNPKLLDAALESLKMTDKSENLFSGSIKLETK